jgi:2-oxoacid:acceptor oxidoreductase delta subunit (pyruvate/2-ketoisovalerate family)
MISEKKTTSEEIKHIYGPCALIFCSTKTGTWRILRPQIDDEKCVYCGTCEKYCPTGVVTIKKDKAFEKKNPIGTTDIDMTYCKGCGICANVCPKDSIAMIDEREA